MAYPQLKGCDQVVCATCGALRARPTPRDVIEMEQSPRRGWGGPTIREVSKMLTLLLLCGVLATPAAANGWFPSWSPSGAHLVSGSGDLSLDGAPLGIVGWGPVFEGEGSFLFTDAASGLSRYTLATRQVTQVRATGFNEIAAGGGVWAGWRSDLIDTSVGSSFSGAGNPTVNQSGALAYVTPRAALVRQLVIGGMVAATCECGELNLARQVAVWTQFTAPAGTWFQLPGDTPHKAAPPRDNEYRPIAIDTPSGPWVGNHTQTGLMLRRVSATDTHGYRFDNGGQAYYPAWVYRADLGAIVAAFSDQAGMLQTHVFPLDAPQVDLATLGAPPTSAPPPPNMCAGFAVTITNYPSAMRVGQMSTIGIAVTPAPGAAVTGLYVDLRNDGYEGLRTTGPGLARLTTLVLVPQAAGVFDLHVEADAGTCHAETGATRNVTVGR